MGKPRLPTTGIRKPRAKDKRVGRKRNTVPADEMEVARTRDWWPTADVHKVGDQFVWVPGEPETVFDDPVAERLSLAEFSSDLADGLRTGQHPSLGSPPSDFDPFDSPGPSGDFGGPHGAWPTVAVDQIRSQAVVDRARAEHDAVPEVQLDDMDGIP